MMTNNLKELESIQYLERKPRVKTDGNPLMLLIHGYGSNEEDLFSFANDLPDEFHVISVRAVHTIMPGMYAWYDISFTDSGKFNNIPQGLKSMDLLLRFIDAITEKENLDKSQVWLCGFSQGAILSYSIALNFPEKIKNVVVLSGYPEPDFLESKIDDNAYSHLNFFISHGATDPVIPVEWGRRGKALLDELKIKNQYHEYPGGHGVDSSNYRDLLQWMMENK